MMLDNDLFDCIKERYAAHIFFDSEISKSITTLKLKINSSVQIIQGKKKIIQEIMKHVDDTLGAI